MSERKNGGRSLSRRLRLSRRGSISPMKPMCPRTWWCRRWRLRARLSPTLRRRLRTAAEATGRIITVEDHYPEGGIGDAVLASLAATASEARVVKLAVTDMTHSGKPAELLAAFGIDADGIADAARQLVREPIAAS